jgi:UDP-N-acetylmuramoyl-tripeptide--D-alanyl-D-alanine ligase
MAVWSGGDWLGSPPGRIEGVSHDTRTIEKGNLYFALAGQNCDGHEFVAEAFRKGASGGVVSRKWIEAQEPGIKGTDRPMLVVEDTQKALTSVAHGYRCMVNPEIVGITGSVGKSTVKEMTAQLLSGTTRTARSCGNWNNDIGLALSLLNMKDDTCVGVFEIGTNHPGEIDVLCNTLEPTWGVITMVGPVHTEFFSSVDAIAEEKATLLRKLPPDGVSVVCRDDPFFDLFKNASPGRTITVSGAANADYVCLNRDAAGSNSLIEEKETGEKFELKLKVPGKHNIVNAMFAIAVARAHGVDWASIREGFEQYKPLPMRWQEETTNGMTVINDAYNANPMSMRAAITAFDEMKVSGKKWLALAGMLELGDREADEHFSIGEFAGSGDWGGIVLVGDLGELIARGVASTGFDRKRTFHCADNAEAAAILTRGLKRSDAVLLKGSRGMHLEEIVSSLKRTDYAEHTE